MTQIEINNLTKLFKNNKGIKNIDLKINEGEIYGFIGPNGAGKSTTIKTILALLKPDSGDSKVLGLDSQLKYADILKEVGYLPSELNYYNNIKAIDLLKYSERFYNKDCSKLRNKLANILDIDLNQKIDNLSYGNKKKVGIIDAIQHEPKILIFDEPTGGLDPLMQNKFFEILENLKENNTTIFFSSHILSEVQRVCDKVAIIKDGVIIDTQNISEFKENKFKEIHIITEEKIDLNNDGISNLTYENNNVKFLFKGDINKLLSELTAYNLIDLKIGEPDLEEVFIHYYE